MKIIFLLFLLTTQILSYSQKYEWDVGIGTPGHEYRQDLTIDSEGNIYVIGSYYGTLDIDPGPGVYNLYGSGSLKYSYVVKYSSSRDLIWAVNFGELSAGQNEGVHIDITNTNELIIVGPFTNEMDADPSSNTHMLYAEDGPYGEYIIKLDLDGNFLWGKAITWGENYSSFQSQDLAIDLQGNTYLTGNYYGTVDFDPSINVYNLNVTQTYDNDGVVVKYNNLGNLVWAIPFTGSSPQGAGISLAYMNSEYLYIGGNFSGTVDFDPSANTDNFTSDDFNFDAFITKLDTSGNYIWTKQVGGIGSQRISSIVCDSQENIYSYGTFKNSTDFDPSSDIDIINKVGYQDIFIQKYNSSGDYIWTKTMGGIDASIVSQGIKMGSDSTIYITGGYNHKVDFDPNTGTHYIETSNYKDIFIEKLDSNGNFLWLRSPKSVENINSGFSSVVRNDDTLYLTGSYSGTLDLNWGQGQSISTSNGFYDYFLVKITGCDSPVYGNATKTSCDSLISLSGNQIFYTSGSYIDTTYTYYGCDSIINFDLTIINSTPVFDSILFSCDSVMWSGQYVSSTGVYDDSLQNITGCDSIRRLHFTYKRSDIDTIATACNSFLWRDSTYQQSGIYKDSLLNSFGCDSITTLNLTILNSPEGHDFQTSCNSFTWTNGITYTVSTNTPTDTIYGGALNGCDSITTLDLTINYDVTSNAPHITCDSLVWIDGNTYYTTNNSASYSYFGVTSTGCDSIVTLDLIVNTVDITTSLDDPSITANATNSTFSWLDCNNNFTPINSETSNTFTPIENGDYAVEVTQNGCVDTSDCITISTVGLGNASILDKVTIVPNPSSGLFNLTLGNWEDVSITVYSSTGSIVFEDNYVNSYEYQLRLNEAPGIYFIEILHNSSEKRFKLILE